MKTKLLFVKRRFLIVILFALMFACLITGTMTSVAFADSVTVIVPTNPGDGTSTIVTVTEDKPVIGDTVSFAGYEWYVIGTDSEGVIAPEGCYTLFAKNNEFGSTAFRSGMSNEDISIVYYKDSDLKKAMDNIANGFSSADIANIVPRATLDGIWGDAVTDQLLWPIAWEEEGKNIATSIRKFGSAYWTRKGYDDRNDVFLVQDPDTGEYYQPPRTIYYSVPIIEASGDIQGSYTLGVSSSSAENPGNTHAVRPAAYVKTDAVEKTESKEYKPVVGSQIQFAGYNWYIVGMGDTGPVPGPANTVTLFAASVINDDDDNVVYVNTANNYADGELSTVMKGLSDTLGLSAREKALITNRTLTTADGISGNSVTTPFWPLSKDEYDAIYEFDSSMGACSNAFYWLRTGYGSSAAYYVDNKGKVDWNYGYTGSGVRPACYLDLSDLFFASGDSGMRASVGEYPSKLEGPLYGSLQNYNFVMHDDTLSLSMVGAATQRNGSSLTFHYDAVQGEQHYLSYLVERASAPGIPVYYGRAVNLSNSGSGTVTVPLTDDGNMRTGIPLVNGDYILRFYTEDRSQGDIIFAGDTVAVGVYVNENKVYISDIKDVNWAAFITGVTITPSSASVENGEQYQFSATVSTDGNEWYDPSITWFVSGENSYGTYISDTGLLTVGIDETSPTITVTAVSVQDNSKRSSVTVSIVYVEPKVAILFRDSTTLYKDVESAVAAISGFETTEENRARIILLDNIDLTSTLTFNTGFITLDLNGNMLKQTGSGSVISIGEGADVVLDDWISATTTHNYYVADNGLWTFYDDTETAPDGAVTGTVTGGVITGGNAATWGGGIYITESTFTMNGGTIAGNTAGENAGGVFVQTNGSFTMNGGTIAGNVATRYSGGGIYVNTSASFTMNGGMIADNKSNGGTAISNKGNVIIAGGYLSGEISSSGVLSINGGYFSQGPNAANIAENCGLHDISALGGADFDSDYIDAFPYAVYQNVTMTVTANENTVYDGSPVAEGVDFTVEGADGVTLTYSYKTDGSDEFTAGLPTNAGEYAVSAYALNGEKQFISIVFDITIAKATYDMSDITFADGNFTYDKEAHSIAISGTLPDGVTVTYEGNDKVNAGEHTVTAKFTGDSANYNAIPDMTAMLTIDKAMPVYTTPENLTICVEHTLADVTLPAGWTWEDGTLSVGETGEKQFKAIFTPEDTLNYERALVNVTLTVSKHTGGTATCTHKAVCSVCGMEYGELAAHVFDRQVVSPEYFASEATCTHKATYYYSCVCGEKGTETFEYGELAPHVFDQKVATAEYLASAATCTQKATYYYSCVCGEKGTDKFEYGELAEHTAVEIPAVEATCTQSGMTAGSKCSVCGEILVAPEEIAPLGHIDEDGDNLCDRCGFDMSITEFTITVSGGTIEGATGSTVIVEENGSVTVTANEAPEGKEFKGWSIDGGETIISAEAAYTFTASEDTVLTAVFADKQSDVKPGGEITPENPEGLSGGAIAGIVIGSVLGVLIIAYGVCALLYKKKIVKGAFFEKIYPFIKD